MQEQEQMNLSGSGGIVANLMHWDGVRVVK